MNFLDKIALKTGIKQRNNFDLSSDHMTTMDFFGIRPVLCLPTVPSGVYNIKASTFTRLSALTEPMMGSARIVNRAFFVPNRTIMDCWNAFITDTPYSATSFNSNIPTSVTTVTGLSIKQMFDQATFSTTVSGAGNADWTDYSGGNTTYKAFTALGRRAFNILWSLGYKIPLADISRDSATYSQTYSALPFLAFFKIYKDWYANQAYDTTFMDSRFYMVNYSLNVSDLTSMMNFINLAMYDKDYFTAASDHPVVPNSGTSSSYNINDISNDSTSSGTDTIVRSLSAPSTNRPSTPSLVASGDSRPANITQYVIDQLKALTDYMRRNQIVGSKAADRMLARFGLRPNDEAMRLSVPFGKDVIPIQISDVMANSNGSAPASGGVSAVSLLGDYAGKGVGYGTSGFRYEAKEYGYIIVVSVVLPKIGYVQGTSRNVSSYINRLDFWTPEFDGKSGNQAIRFDELKGDFLNSQMVTVGNMKPDSVWGFIPRWSDLKLGFDNMTGDFALNSRNSNMNAWHLFRLFGYRGAAVAQTDTYHNQTFTIGQQDHYDRIFAYTQNTFDHFIINFHFDVKASLPMAKVFDTYEFDGGRDVNVEVNGTQFE